MKLVLYCYRGRLWTQLIRKTAPKVLRIGARVFDLFDSVGEAYLYREAR